MSGIKNDQVDLTPISSIFIDGDVELITMAMKMGWDDEGNRDGTHLKPYLIQNYQINPDANYSIKILNTNLHVVILNIEIEIVKISSTGIYLSNIGNITIEQVTIRSISEGGSSIHIENSRYVLVRDSILSGAFTKGVVSDGITLFNTSRISVLRNSLNDFDNGIIVSNSNNGIFQANSIQTISKSGLRVLGSNYVHGFENIISNSKWGITGINNRGTVFTGNQIQDNTENGIEISGSDFTNIANNSLVSNSIYGIKIKTSNDTTVRTNTIVENLVDGLAIFTDSNNTLVVLNNFINNGVSGSQVEIIGSVRNNFSENYWSDHPPINKDGDKYADQVYTISPGVTDQFPLIREYTATGFDFTFPDTDISVEDELNISWTPFETSYDTRFTYLVVISELGITSSQLFFESMTKFQLISSGGVLKLIITGIEATSISVSTKHLSNGSNYFLTVAAVSNGDAMDDPLINYEYEGYLLTSTHSVRIHHPAVNPQTTTTTIRNNITTTTIKNNITFTQYEISNQTVINEISTTVNRTLFTEFTTTRIQEFSKGEAIFPSILSFALIPLLVLYRVKQKN